MNWLINFNEALENFLHWLTNGRQYPHKLEGGWCPTCGAVHCYPGWYVWNPRNQWVKHINQHHV